MAKQKEFDFVTTFRTVGGVKKKKLQTLLEATLAEVIATEGFEESFIDTEGKLAVQVTGLTFSEIRKVNEDGTVEGEDTPEVEENDELLAAAQELDIDLSGLYSPQAAQNTVGPATVA